MIRILTLTALLSLAACSEVPDQVHGKLLCLYDTNEAFTAYKNVGDTMFIRRQMFADPLCKGRK